MYWRIRKLTPDVVFKKFGVHAVLIVSVIANLFLYTRVSAGHAMSTVQKTDYDRFARQVSQHLFDASYLTFDDSMMSLSNELAASAANKLKQSEVIPKNEDEMRAISRQMLDAKSVSCIKFEQVTVGDPVTQGPYRGMLPIDLRVQVIIHDTEGVRPTSLKLRYYVGMATNQKTKEQHPVVVDLEQSQDTQ